MWDPSLRLEFVDEYCRKHGPEEFFATFFDPSGNLLPNAPQELRDEVAIIRGEKRWPFEVVREDK